MFCRFEIMNTLTWSEFEKVDIRVGTILLVEEFPQARNPSYKVTVDFGELGIKKTSAQITKNYSKNELIGKQILGVVNFPPKQIANFISEFLLTGFKDSTGEIVIATVDSLVPNGEKLI